MFVTLIGSSRYVELFRLWNRALSMKGHTVYSLGALERITDVKEKIVADAVHLSKIANSDGVVIINGSDDYWGESTMRELIFAHINGLKVYHTHEVKKVKDMPVEIWSKNVLELVNPTWAYPNQCLTQPSMGQASQAQSSPPALSARLQQALDSVDPQLA